MYALPVVSNNQTCHPLSGPRLRETAREGGHGTTLKESERTRGNQNPIPPTVAIKLSSRITIPDEHAAHPQRATDQAFSWSVGRYPLVSARHRAPHG